MIAPDGRLTALGWMSNWQYAAEVPTMQYRSANTLPREIGLFRGADGAVYASSKPSPELIELRDKLVVNASKTTVGKKGRSYQLPSANGGICEILLDIEAQKADSVMITLANKAGDEVVMCYDNAAHTVSFDRRRSGLVDFSEGSRQSLYRPLSKRMARYRSAFL